MRQAHFSWERVEIWPQYIRHPTNLGVVPELIEVEPFLLPGVAQVLQGNINSQLVSILETVGNRLGQAGNRYLRPRLIFRPHQAHGHGLLQCGQDLSPGIQELHLQRIDSKHLVGILGIRFHLEFQQL